MEKKNNHPEKRLQEKAEEFYKASSDFNEKEDHWQEFFEELRKILYYAMLFKTPEELIYERIDAEKPLLGVLNKEIERPDRKSTRLNSSHVAISYAVFCLKKKTKKNTNKCGENRYV